MVLTLMTLVCAPSWAADGDKLKAAADLPRLAESLRENGVPQKEVADAIRAGRDGKVPAEETKEVLEEAEKSVKEHGPVDNFGAFVQARLKEGLRGKDLAAAIRAEHEANGKGKGHGHGKDGEHGKQGKSGDPGKAGKGQGPSKEAPGRVQRGGGKGNKAKGKAK